MQSPWMVVAGFAFALMGVCMKIGAAGIIAVQPRPGARREPAPQITND